MQISWELSDWQLNPREKTPLNIRSPFSTQNGLHFSFLVGSRLAVVRDIDMEQRNIADTQLGSLDCLAARF